VTTQAEPPAPPPTDLALDVRDLVVRYGSTTAVGGVTLSLPRGRVLGLLGNNGAGKTSMLQVCEGYRPPDAGAVRVLGLDPIADHDRLMPRIGIMLQSGGVYNGARAGEVLRLFASFAANPLDVDMLIERLDLHDSVNTAYRRLSGGQKQRLALAMALVGRPELVFLDEPSAGMDTESRHGTWDLIEELRADGVAVVLTTHLLDEAERLADDVVIIDHGRVVATGTPAQLTAADGIEQLQLRADANLPVAKLARSLAQSPESARLNPASAEESTPGNYTVTGRLDAATAAAVLTWFAQHDAHITELNTRRRTLEDVYLTLTDRSVPR
jgi:ABC-2 type transport system ATP-binding protein